MKKRTATIPYGVLLAALALLTCGCLLTAAAHARFSSSVARDVTVEPAAAQPLCLLPQEDGAESTGVWQLTADGACQRSFRLQNYSGANTASGDMTVELRLLASLGIESPDALEVTLTEKTTEQVTVPAEPGETGEPGETAAQPQVTETVYRGVPTAIDPGTPLETAFGPGWSYRFYRVEYGADGQMTVSAEPASWSFSGGKPEQKELTVRVTARQPLRYDSWLRVTAVWQDR